MAQQFYAGAAAVEIMVSTNINICGETLAEFSPNIHDHKRALDLANVVRYKGLVSLMTDAARHEIEEVSDWSENIGEQVRGQ